MANGYGIADDIADALRPLVGDDQAYNAALIAINAMFAPSDEMLAAAAKILPKKSANIHVSNKEKHARRYCAMMQVAKNEAVRARAMHNRRNAPNPPANTSA